MPERLDPSVQLPQFDVMPVNELPGEPYGFCVVSTHEVNAILDVTILSQNEGAVTLHGMVSEGFSLSLLEQRRLPVSALIERPWRGGPSFAFWFTYDSVKALQANSNGSVH
jgi:hypothetical protein